MAANKKLTKLFTEIADSIREVDGSIGKMTASEFPANIRSLKEEKPTPTRKAVNFYDYDGTLLYSYSWKEILTLTELPPLPKHTGLICQEWNYSLADILKQRHHRCDIGATYITDDGSTRLYINLKDAARLDINLLFNQTLQNGVLVDWGDGSETETFEIAGNISCSHVYTEAKRYVIRLFPIDGCSLYLGHNAGGYSVMGYISDEISKWRADTLEKIEIGANLFQFVFGGFNWCDSLKYITIPNTVAKGRRFLQNEGLKFLVFPKNFIIEQSDQTFNSSYNLRGIIFPPTTTYIYESLSSCNALEFLTIPDGVKSISTLNNKSGIKEIIYPPTVENLGVISSYHLEKVVLPPYLEEIGSSLFYSSGSHVTQIYFPPFLNYLHRGSMQACKVMKFYDFTACKQVPLLDNVNAFIGIPADCEIRVPEDLYEEWVAATNWTTYADYIKSYPASEYDYEKLIED